MGAQAQRLVGPGRQACSARGGRRGAYRWAMEQVLTDGRDRAGEGVMARVALAASDIKLAHTVFAMPFAVLGAFMARPEGASWGRFAGQAGLVVACMVLGRTWAMLVNRLADAELDAANPRTRGRAVASGRLSTRDGWMMAWLSAAGFVLCAAGFWALYDNPWPVALSLPVLAFLALYSYAKRFTALCHLLLGTALALAPLAAALAVEPASVTAMGSLWLIAGMVVLWVAGFDVIYALQDVDFDRRAGLYSLPSRLGEGERGPRRAVVLSRLLHAGAAALLLAAGLSDPRLGWVFLAASGAACACLVLEHLVLARRGLAGLPIAFFTLNGVVSVLVGLAGVVDVVEGAAGGAGSGS
jgi:4-hydroxybenzoate polyprenyltransferase